MGFLRDIYGKKSIDNLFKGIENSKNNSLEKLLFGLGIRNVGAKTAKILARHYKTLDNIINTTEMIDINIMKTVLYIATGIYSVYILILYVIGKKQLELGVNVE